MTKLLLGLVTLLSLAAPAWASNDVCSADRDKLCAGKEWGQGLAECLEQNRRHVSIECRRMVEDIRMKQAEKTPEQRHKSGASCKDDADKLCRGIRRGRQQRKCLREHREELTADCRGLVDKWFRH